MSVGTAMTFPDLIACTAPLAFGSDAGSTIPSSTPESATHLPEPQPTTLRKAWPEPILWRRGLTNRSTVPPEMPILKKMRVIRTSGTQGK